MNWIHNLNLRGRIIEISQRFPVVLSFAFLTTITLILTLDDESGTLFRWPVAGFIGFLAVFTWTLYCESITGSKKIFWPGIMLILLFLSIYYYQMPSEINQKASCFWYFTMGLSIILHLLISVVPFLYRYDKIVFINFNISIFKSWMQSALYALLLFFALSLSILALDNLFDMSIKSILYFKLFILITGLIQSTLFLSDVPDHFDDRSIPAPKSVFKVIVFYLFIPVSILYGLIIYAYFFRVIFTTHEMVEWTFVMILWYFGVGIISWLFAGYYENPQGNFLISNFRRWFFPASVLPGIFLFVSIYKNIINSGIKEEFYLSAIAATFIGIVVLIFLSGISKDHRLIPITAILLCVAGFWSGPFSVCHVPVKNIQKSLITDLGKAGLIKNGVLTIDTSMIYQDSSGDITQKLYYLNGKGALGFIKDYDSNHLIKEERDSINLNSFLDLIRLNASNNDHKTFIEYTHKQSGSYDINGFEKIIPVYNYNVNTIDKDYINIENDLLILYIEGKKAGDLDINKEILELSDNEHNNNIIEREINGYQIRIILNSVSGQRSGNKINNLNISSYVLLRKVHK